MKIAIIGSGISGMTCAHLLSRNHDVILLEKAPQLGGHTATRHVHVAGGKYAIDTGFIVFNDRTYPRFNRLLEQIGVPRKPTEMSFSVVNPELNLQYNGHSLNTLFAQRRNLLRPSFYQLVKEILRFNALAKQADQLDPNVTLQAFLDDHNFNNEFAENYLLPMGAAIWSASLDEFRQFSMRFFSRFFINHGLLDIKNRPQWYVIPGGSRQYIEPLLKPLKQNIRLDSHVTQILRSDEGVSLQCQDGWQWQGDQVIFACHSDEALAILGENATPAERNVLGRMKYQSNRVVLHSDESVLPSIKRARASWNYRLPPKPGRGEQLACVTYDMNRLQGLIDAPQFCVTLNPQEPIADEKIIETFDYAHPKFDLQSMQAQQERHRINGQNQSWFCGAYWYNGFHEDGVHSATDVCEALGVTL
jgi:predicted NAD/FAD-binding protein